jgi:hypothetical protein
MTKNTRNGLIIAGVVVAMGAFLVVFGDEGKKPQPPRFELPPKSDADYMADHVRDATSAAKQVLSERFKAPSQVEYLDRRLRLVKDNFALVSVTLDAPNSFGVKLRSNWCYILEFLPPRGKEFTWNKDLGVWQCSEHVDRDDLLARQAVVGWPGARDALTAKARENETARR